MDNENSSEELVTLKVPARVHTALKTLAASSRGRLNALATDLLERGLSGAVASSLSDRARAVMLLEAANEKDEIARLDPILSPYIKQIQKDALIKKKIKREIA
jgi:hypothetical protein